MSWCLLAQKTNDGIRLGTDREFIEYFSDDLHSAIQKHIALVSQKLDPIIPEEINEHWRDGKTNRDFNRNPCINPVNKVEINIINSQTLQTTLTGLSHILWITTNFRSATFQWFHPKFSSKLDFLPWQPLQPLHPRKTQGQILKK